MDSCGWTSVAYSSSKWSLSSHIIYSRIGTEFVFFAYSKLVLLLNITPTFATRFVDKYSLNYLFQMDSYSSSHLTLKTFLEIDLSNIYIEYKSHEKLNNDSRFPSTSLHSRSIFELFLVLPWNRAKYRRRLRQINQTNANDVWMGAWVTLFFDSKRRNTNRFECLNWIYRIPLLGIHDPYHSWVRRLLRSNDGWVSLHDVCRSKIIPYLHFS